MSGELTSVIVPCWNALPLTRVCLRQLISRTTAPFELVIIDNGSTDGTGAWLKRQQIRFLRGEQGPSLKRFAVISNPKNEGYPIAMNLGVAAARGRYVLFGNADVAVTPFWLEHMISALKSKSRIGAISAFSNPPRRPEDPVAWSCPPHYRGIKGLERYSEAFRLARRAPLYFPAKGFFPGFWFLTKKSVLDEIGCFDERYSPGGFEDLDLQWRMRRAGYALGFAGRTFVHHISFGCAQLNGLKVKNLYGPNRRRILHRKFPAAARMTYSENPEFWLAERLRSKKT